MDDVMARLRGADPARTLDTVDAAAFAALREEITMTRTSSEPRPAVRRRLRRRTAVTVGVVAVLAGGGVAYASGILGNFGGNIDGPSCMTVWGDGSTEAAGPWLTGDAIADCATIREHAGLTAIADPVAFRHNTFVFVTPADQVPDGAEVLASPVIVEPAVNELRTSARDLVDGALGACRTRDEQAAWARSELDRLGLDGWSVQQIDPSEVDDGPRPCTVVDAERTPGVVWIIPVREEPVVGWQGALVTALRTQVADRCLSLAEAAAVVDRILDEELDDDDRPLFYTASIADEQADCARVDLVIGGGGQVTLHGPTTARG